MDHAGRPRPLQQHLLRHAPDGLPYMAPHLQLLKKAKETRPHCDADFAAVFPLLDADEAQWLTDALRRH